MWKTKWNLSEKKSCVLLVIYSTLSTWKFHLNFTSKFTPIFTLVFTSVFTSVFAGGMGGRQSSLWRHGADRGGTGIARGGEHCWGRTDAGQVKEFESRATFRASRTGLSSIRHFLCWVLLVCTNATHKWDRTRITYMRYSDRYHMENSQNALSKKHRRLRKRC